MKEIVARCYVSLQPRFYSILSIIFMTTGVNMLTALEEQDLIKKALIGSCALLSGISLYMIGYSVEEYYRIAYRRYDRNKSIMGPKLNDLAINAALEGRMWNDLLWLGVAMLALVILGLVIFGNHDLEKLIL